MAKTKDEGLIDAAIARLKEEGPSWTTQDRQRWVDMFEHTVEYVYPGRKPRPSRAKGVNGDG